VYLHNKFLTTMTTTTTITSI